MSFTCLVKSKPVKQEVSRTVIAPRNGEPALTYVNFTVLLYCDWALNWSNWSPGDAVEQVTIVLAVDPPFRQVKRRLASPQSGFQLRMKDDLFSKLPEHFDAFENPLGLVLRNGAHLDLVQFCVVGENT